MASSETNEALPWHDADWLADVERWVDARVERTGALENFHSYPWATAIRVPTTAGIVWFKACIAPLAHEVRTLEILSARRPEVVPALLAGDRERGWMLLEDAGERMRELEEQPGHLERWERSVALYAQLQLDVAVDADAFVAGGVPDRRGSVVEQFARVIEDERVTRPPIEDPLTDGEIDVLRAVLPRLAAEEEYIDALGVPYTIQHEDLHDANVFVRDGSFRIIDWGDACVANALLSLAIPNEVLAHRLATDVDAPEVGRVRDAYLEPFVAVHGREDLRDAVPAVMRVGHACGTIKWHEVMTAIPPQHRAPFDRGIPRRLRRLIELCA